MICSLVALNSYLSAVTEKITGRDQDECPDDPRRDEDDYSTGQAKNDMGNSRMDILRSEIACERRNINVDVSRKGTLRLGLEIDLAGGAILPFL